MNWPALIERLAAAHPGDPQRIARIELAVQQASAGLTGLGALGYRFHLAPGPEPEQSPFPRRVFHIDAAPNGRTVRDEFELADLGPGWYGTLEAAQFADGLDTQFSGRGGLPRRALPAVLEGMSLEEIFAAAARAQAEKAARIAEFKAQRAQAQSLVTSGPPPANGQEKERVA